MKITSYFWKKDSLANNGYRICAVSDLLKCKLDRIDKNYLVRYLGKPDRIRRSNRDIAYLYFYYDYRNLPKDTDLAAIVYYISFSFKSENGLIEEISKGHMD